METPYFPENVPMPSGSSPVPIEALLAHQGYVRALARQLVRDPHAAEDLAQETWLKASASPPREHASLGGWFARVLRNRASNVRRDTNRRTSRERDVARSESIEPTDVAERVELEARVVRAVLALREPYRGVILGRYYEDTSTAELARRQGVTESSVRSQETRALELLRRELDETFDGGRAAWSALLVPLASGDAAASTGVPIALSLFAGAAIFVTAAVWTLHQPSREHDTVELAGDIGSAPVPHVSVADGAEPGDVAPPGLMGEAASRDRESALAPVLPPAPDAVAAITRDATPADLDALAVNDLLRLTVHTQAALRARLLTPEPALVAPYAKRIASGEFGVTRILERATFGAFGRHDLLGIREGGSTLAFLADSHDFDDVPDIHLSEGRFRAREGVVVHVGAMELDALPSAADEFDPAWDEGTRAGWTLAWRDVPAGSRDRDPEFDRDMRAWMQSHGAMGTARVGETYVVRTIQPDVRNVLIAFRSIAADEYGHTLVWRKLHEWPLEMAPRGPVSTPVRLAPADAGASPAWLASAEVEQLFEWLARVRTAAAPKVLALPAGLEAQFTPLFERTRGAVVKLVHPGPLNALVTERWGGSYCSFLEPPGSEVVAYGNTLGYQDGSFQAGLWGGDVGWQLDLGELPLTGVTDSASAPDALGTAGIAAWEFIWKTEPDGAESSGRLLTEATSRRADEFGLRRGVEPRPGHTYLIRSIRSDESQPELAHDLTVALHVLARDEYGFIVAWRVLRELPPPAPR